VVFSKTRFHVQGRRRRFRLDDALTVPAHDSLQLTPKYEAAVFGCPSTDFGLGVNLQIRI
jgi:hypothetical protein